MRRQVPAGVAVEKNAEKSSERHSAPVIVILGDAPLIRPETLAGLSEFHAAEGAAATIVTAVRRGARGAGGADAHLRH